MNQEVFAVIGLGYVGLPVALAFGRRHSRVIGFDINQERVASLRRGVDATGECDAELVKGSAVIFTSDPADLAPATFYIVAVPTPVDAEMRPDLSALLAATQTVGASLRRGDIVVYESTVYPGVTEDICGPVLEASSGLKRDRDFSLGYSPERINPGDREHTFERIRKVVAAESPEALTRVSRAYESVVHAGIFQATTIRVAEAAKVIENTQRDLNIALMNELALLFDRIGIKTRDVLEAAATKWNFQRFEPGLVGGHCVGVDPYYLTTLAERVGYHPQVILAGRRINESMGAFVAQRLVKLLIRHGVHLSSARVGILGLTFKEDTADLRNTKVTEVLRELRAFGIEPAIHDPIANPAATQSAFGTSLTPWDELTRLDALLLAVPHRAYLQQGADALSRCLVDGGLFFDLKGRFPASEVPHRVTYITL